MKYKLIIHGENRRWLVCMYWSGDTISKTTLMYMCICIKENNKNISIFRTMKFVFTGHGIPKILNLNSPQMNTGNMVKIWIFPTKHQTIPFQIKWISIKLCRCHKEPNQKIFLKKTIAWSPSATSSHFPCGKSSCSKNSQQPQISDGSTNVGRTFFHV